MEKFLSNNFNNPIFRVLYFFEKFLSYNFNNSIFMVLYFFLRNCCLTTLTTLFLWYCIFLEKFLPNNFNNPIFRVLYFLEKFLSNNFNNVNNHIFIILKKRRDHRNLKWKVHCNPAWKSSVVYLGSRVAEDGSTVCAIKNRICCAETVVKRLNERVFSRRSVSDKLKGHFVESAVFSSLLCNGNS